MRSHQRWARAATKAKRARGPTVRTSSEQLLKDLREGLDLSRWEPDLCVQMLRLPSVNSYTAIRKLLERARREWLLEFLECDGLGVLLESLNRLGDQRVHSVADTFTQMECMSCLRTVINFRPGLHYIVQRNEYTRKLAAVLSSSNPTVKLQVYELLCAVSLASPQGHALSLDALEHFKVYRGLRYRFEVVLSELSTAESDVLCATLLAFVNCLVFGCEDLHQRHRIRNEFLGLGLGKILSKLRNSGHELVQIQVEVFDEKLHRDQVELEKDPVNLSPQQLFDIIFTKVADSPQALHFHSVLLNLSQLDTSQPATDRVWEALEEISAGDNSASKSGNMQRARNFVIPKMVRNESTQTPSRGWPRGRFLKPLSVEVATQVDKSDIWEQDVDFSFTPVQETLNHPSEVDAISSPLPPFKTPETQSSYNLPDSETEGLSKSPSPLPATDFATSPSSLQTSEVLHHHTSGVINLSAAQFLSPQCNISDISGSPAPLPMTVSPAPPPPPLPSAVSDPPPVPTAVSGPPPVPTAMHSPPAHTLGYMTVPSVRSSLPSDIISSGSRTADSKFNTWHGRQRKMRTINWTKIPKTLTGNCMWTGVEALPNLKQLDLQQLEELFCQKTGNSKNERAVSTPVTQPVVVELNLLDSKRSLAVNIFLRQIKGRGAAVVKAVQEACSRELGAEKLRGLQRLLPEQRELELLSAHADEADRFGAAEKYFCELSRVPGFALRVEAMLQREDFPTHLEELRPQLQGLVNMCDQLIGNSSLRAFLTLVLQIGNCLNAGSYAGNAAGFKLNTLPKLLDTRANKPRMTFLHFVVQVAETTNKAALAFIKDLSNITNICKISVEGLEDEIRQLTVDIKKLDCQLNEDKNGIRSYFKEFMEQAVLAVGELQQGVQNVKDASARLARHFCEDPEKFQLEECFKLFSDFFRRTDEVRKENEQRQKQERRAAQRTVTNKLSNKKSVLKSGDSEVCLVDRLMEEIRSGTFKLRRSEG